MLYLIEETKLVGAIDYDELGNNTVLYLQGKPGLTNSGRKEVTDGWLGTTNDVYAHAHGVFENVEKAEAFIERKFSCFKLSEAPEDFDPLAEEELYVYRDERNYCLAADWLQYVEPVEVGVQVNSSDYALEMWAERLEGEALTEKVALVGTLEYLYSVRQALRTSLYV